MTEKEYHAKLGDVEVASAELALRKARLELDRGYERLKIDVDEAVLKVEREKLWRQWKQAEVEKPFETN